MKYGYRIVIHKDIPKELKKNVLIMCDNFIQLASKGHSYPIEDGKLKQISKSYGNGGWVSFYKRGTFGLLESKYKKLVFRRLSKNRRIFGVVPVEYLINENNEKFYIDKCICPKCLGMQKAKMIDGPYKDENYNIYYEIGDIKG